MMSIVELFYFNKLILNLKFAYGKIIMRISALLDNKTSNIKLQC